MTNQIIQIQKLFEQGNAPEQIAEMLNYQLVDVLIVLNSLGLVKAPEPGIVNEAKNTSVANIESISPDDTNPTDTLYKQFHRAVAQKIIDTALSDSDRVDSSIALKAAIYVNEEATGRNAKRADRTANNSININIQKILMDAKRAKDSISQLASCKVLELPAA